MNKLAPLDRALSRLPSRMPSEDLPGRVCRYVRIRRRRRLFLNLGLHFVLIATGLWLISPLFVTLFASVDLSGSGLSMLLEWSEVALTGIESYVSYVWNGLTGLQSNIASPVTDTVGLGVAILTLGVLLALGQLLRRNASLMDEGVKV